MITLFKAVQSNQFRWRARRAVQWCRARVRRAKAFVLSAYLLCPEHMRAGRVPFDVRMLVEGVCDLDVEGIDTRDAPDFCDAFLTAATWKRSGDALTEAELDELNEDHSFVYDAVIDRLY